MVLHLLLVLVLLLVPLIAIHRRYFCQRDSVPLLHPLSPYTSLPILVPTLLGRRNTTIHSGHRRLGPIVRLSPREISVASPDLLSTIYTGFPKSEWYNVFRNYGVAPMFAMLSGKEHAARKKTLAGAYSNTTISRSPILRKVAEEALPMLLRGFDGAGKEGVEVWSRFVQLTMDFVTAFLFTRELGSRFLEGEDPDILESYHSRRGYFAVSSELPRVADWIVPSRVHEANEKIEAWCRRLCEARRSERVREGGDGGEREEKCALDRVLAAGSPEDALYVASEMLDHIGAGHETTALALSFTLAAMSQRPDLQVKLRQSLAPLLEERGGWRVPRQDGYRALEEHALLNAVIKESLRLHAPIPGSQPRVAPRDISILRHPVPAGTIVSSQAWTLHRDPSIWGPDADEFSPERWLEGRGVEKAWWAFGSGGRGCIGQHLARWELRVVLASIYGNFETAGSEVGGVDAYTTAPSRAVEIVFARCAT